LIRGFQALRSWESPITRHPQASPASSLPSNIPGRMISRGNCFPRLSPLPGTHRGVPPPICRPYVIFSLHNYLSIGLFGTRPYRNLRNKNLKVPPHVRRQPQSIPLNAAQNGCELGWQCSIYERSIASSPRAPDRVSFLGTRGLPTLAHPFALRLGATQLTGGLALVDMRYTDIYLGYELLFRSPGAGPDTLSSRVRGGGVIPCHACYR